jgi:hypothetical protein
MHEYVRAIHEIDRILIVIQTTFDVAYSVDAIDAPRSLAQFNMKFRITLLSTFDVAYSVQLYAQFC